MTVVIILFVTAGLSLFFAYILMNKAESKEGTWGEYEYTHVARVFVTLLSIALVSVIAGLIWGFS